MLDIIMPSYRGQWLERFLQTWVAQGLDEMSTVSVAAQGDSIPVAREWRDFSKGKVDFIEAEYASPPYLWKLRKDAKAIRQSKGWCISMDDDQQFRPNAKPWLLETLRGMETVERLTGRSPYLSMSGALGGVPSGGRIVVSPYGTYSTARGFIFPGWIPWPEQYDWVRGPGEDKMIGAAMIISGASLPLRRFFAPATIWRRKGEDQKKADKDHVYHYQSYLDGARVAIREMSGDPEADVCFLDDGPRISPQAKTFGDWAKKWHKYTNKGEVFNMEISMRIFRETGW